MGKYIAKRILSGVITIVILITACFFLMHAIPGSPFAKGEQGVPEAVMQRLNEKYGLDQPLYKQYFTYLDQILHGDFGISYKNSSVQVNDLIERGFPISARIGILAVLLSLVVGVLLGVTSAVKRGSLFDGISMVIATIGVCVPLFVISVLLLYLFAGVLKWLPTYGLSTWKHYILPVTCLSFSPIAYIARMTRSSMLEVMQQDYIRTARAKGVAERMVILKHGLRNAILPTVTVLGMSEVCIENYSGITEYTDTLVRIRTKHGQIQLKGSCLEIEFYTNDEMKITGSINLIEFQEGRNLR